ncbi:winged helix-turn-helix transcriptional regulator [Sphingomonas sp. ASY06-1R]|uniref:winged helix-turn-helix transcriptional regulator n=1 Tax=Sphingomonas sp. ASY06-1R TaxID=3445771 RepID=UPI003FA2EC5F
MMTAVTYFSEMLGIDYEGQDCSAARALELVGERWNLLILRDAIFRRTTQFNVFQRSLGVATNILTKRLERFVQTGLMQGPIDGHYHLTDKGRDFAGVVAALTAWGDRWVSPGPVDFVEGKTGNLVVSRLVRLEDGAEVASADVAVRRRTAEERQAASASASA